MAGKKKAIKAKDDAIFGGLKGKLLLWLQAYLNEMNPASYMNQTGAARVAGYPEKSCMSIGYQNYRKLQPRIAIWLDDVGLSEGRLKSKLLSLIDSHQIVLTKVKGRVAPEDLPAGSFVVAESSKMAWGGKGEDAEAYDDGDSVVAVKVEAIETQRRSLDMAFKVKGLYAPEKVQVEDVTPVSPEDRKALKDMARALARKAAKG